MRNIILMLLLALFVASLHAQSPVTPFVDWLSLDSSFALGDVTAGNSQKDWVATASQGRFYCCQRKGFGITGKTYCCVIYRVDLKTGQQDTFRVEYPNLGTSWKKEAQSCCVYALSVEDDHLLLVCDNRLLLYQYDNYNYKFVKYLQCTDACMGYLCHRAVYALVDDKERGVFRWLCFDKEDGQQARVIRELVQTAPFLLQFAPNRYLFADEHSLYYMPPGDCVVYKYSLDGHLVDSVCFHLPDSKPFPEELLSRLRSLPYGTERIYHALQCGYRRFSFAKAVDPLSDSLLLLSVNLGDENRQRQMAVLRLRKTGTCWRQDFSTLAVADTGTLYKDGLFPVSYHLSADNLLLYPYQNQLIQLIQAPEEELFEGKSVIWYRHYKDLWYKKHDPIVKIRVQTVKKDMFFYDYDNNRVTMSDLPHDKVILLVSRQPQCSACQKQLLLFLSSLDTSWLCIAVQMGKQDSYLARRQQLQSMSELVPRFYIPLYDIENEDYSSLRRLDSYPAIFLWKRNFGFVGIYATEDIFTTNYDRYEISDTFLHDFQQFLTQE